MIGIWKLDVITSFCICLDVGRADKYRYPNGSHQPSQKIKEFVGETFYASRWAMANMTQGRRDDIESLYFVLLHLAGLSSTYVDKNFRDLYKEKEKLSVNLTHIVSHSFFSLICKWDSTFGMKFAIRSCDCIVVYSCFYNWFGQARVYKSTVWSFVVLKMFI